MAVLKRFSVVGRTLEQFNVVFVGFAVLACITVAIIYVITSKQNSGTKIILCILSSMVIIAVIGSILALGPNASARRILNSKQWHAPMPDFSDIILINFTCTMLLYSCFRQVFR